MGSNAQSEDFKFFLKHHDELLKDYDGKYVVLKDRQVIASGITFEDALENAIATGAQPGTFIIQLCTEGDSGYTQKFRSRAIFVHA